MFNYLVAALAAFALTSTPAVAQEEPTAVEATCAAQIGTDTFGPEACHVIVQPADETGAMAIGFVLPESGAVIFAGQVENNGLRVVMIGFGEEPIEATGTCSATQTVLTCQAVSRGVPLTLKAVL